MLADQRKRYTGVVSASLLEVAFTAAGIQGLRHGIPPTNVSPVTGRAPLNRSRDTGPVLARRRRAWTVSRWRESVHR
jgi:hypothetical protein